MTKTPEKLTCRFCPKEIVNEYLRLCEYHFSFHRNTDPPRGGKAAGTTFEEEPEEMAMAVGGR